MPLRPDTAARTAACLAGAALLGLACTGQPVPSVDPGWHATHGRDHALAGRILDVAGGRFVGEAELWRRLAAVEVVVLGERHDHPDHHRLQGRAVDALVARGARPAVAFEMLERGLEPAIAAARAQAPGDASAIRRAVRWDASGWPDWAVYAPVFDAAVRAGLPILPANLARADVQAIAHGGLAALDPALRAWLALEAEAPPAERDALAEAIRLSHCGFAPEAMIGRMVDVQRAWNASLGRAALDAARANGTSVLVTGNEHARRDYGAPAAIARIDSGARVASLAFWEVDPSSAAPGSRAGETDQAVASPYDFVWFTPRIDLEDPCERHREALERMQRERTPRDPAQP